jgi:hypothetical protein
VKITRSRLLNLLENFDEEFEYVEENILFTKHSDEHRQLVLKNKQTDEFFGVDYVRNYDWGIESYGDLEFYPMKAVQKTVYVRT